MFPRLYLSQSFLMLTASGIFPTTVTPVVCWSRDFRELTPTLSALSNACRLAFTDWLTDVFFWFGLRSLKN